LAEFRSSPPVRRGFCGTVRHPAARIGTRESPDSIDVTTCSLDEPAGGSPPTHHSWLSERRRLGPVRRRPAGIPGIEDELTRARADRLDRPAVALPGQSPWAAKSASVLELDARGVAGDRRYAILNREGKLGSGKTTRRFGRSTACSNCVPPI
jgi:hypothetical protein